MALGMAGATCSLLFVGRVYSSSASLAELAASRTSLRTGSRGDCGDYCAYCLGATYL
jgi:hypothetical protein